MTKYVKRGECEARKVTDKDGEQVITSNGPEHAPHGSYVVTETVPAVGEGDHDTTVTRVQEADAFALEWKASGSGSNSRGTTKRAAPRKSTQGKQTGKQTPPKKRVPRTRSQGKR